jgi:predicted enzyme related to lactoylglutathione lyase
MSEEPTGSTPGIGHPAWFDLTVPNAEETRDFYGEVLGWRPTPVPMGDYDDFVMNAPDGSAAAGICHARGGNAGLPPVWLVYFLVEDLDGAVASARRGGGEVLAEPRSAGGGRYAVIRDPAGAVCALFQKG